MRYAVQASRPRYIPGAGGVVLFIVAVASLMRIRRVLRLEPAVVFRG